MAKRGNPVEGKGSKVVLNQGVNTPIGDSSNTDKGNPAKSKVPGGKKTTISQSVGFPAAPTVDYMGKSKRK